MNRLAPLTLLTLLAALAGTAHAGITSQSFEIDIDTTTGTFGQDIVLNQFDTMGGLRQLTGVQFRYDATLAIDALAQSYEPETIAAGTWSAEIIHSVIVAFNSEGEGEGRGGDPDPAPFLGLGGIAFPDFTGELGPGIPGDPPGNPFDPGTPGTPTTGSTSGTLNSVINLNSNDFAFFTGDGSVNGFIGPFIDIVITPPPGGAFIEVLTELTQFGSLTVDYQFTEIPAPGTIGMIAATGLLAGRRRR